MTKTEDKILSPLYRADLRAYEAVRNAMATGVDEMKKEQSMLQRKHPAQSEGGGAAASKPMPTGEKLEAYTRAHPEFGGDQEKAKEFLRSQGYQ